MESEKLINITKCIQYCSVSVDLPAQQKVTAECANETKSDTLGKFYLFFQYFKTICTCSFIFFGIAWFFYVKKKQHAIDLQWRIKITIADWEWKQEQARILVRNVQQKKK